MQALSDTCEYKHFNIFCPKKPRRQRSAEGYENTLFPGSTSIKSLSTQEPKLISENW